MGKKGVKQGKNPEIITCHEINTSSESKVLLSQAHFVALPGGLGLRGSETVWVL